MTRKPTPVLLSGSAAAGRITALILGVAFALVMLGMAQASAASSSRTNAPDFAAIDEYVQKQIEEMRMPGLALGIVKGDETIHLKGFGEADDSGRAVTSRTPFIIGSTSKSFTALAIMQLVEDGKVKLDAPVRRYLPWFRVATPGASSRITVRELLNQTSGMSTASGEEYVQRKDSSAGALEKAVRSLSTVELDRPVGKTFEYSNLNYTILGLIVQTVSGQSYEQYVKEHILTPLDMKDSYMSVPEAERHGLATGHQYWFGYPFSGGGLPYNRATTPSGYISSSAQDMSHYLIAQLNNGRYESARVLSPEGIAELHRGAADMHGGPYYAMGWVESKLGGVPVVWHDGDTGDFHTTMILAPGSGWGVVVLMNGSNDLRLQGMDGIANGVVARLVGTEPPPQPGVLGEPIRDILFVILAAIVIQVVGIARSVVLLHRWRTHPARRPRGVLRVGLRVVLPLALNLMWAVVCLIVLPQFSQTPLQTMLSLDAGLVTVLSGAVALVWGAILKPVLAFLALRERGASKTSDPPTKTGTTAQA